MIKYIYILILFFTFSCDKDTPGSGFITLQLDHNVAGFPMEIEQLIYNSAAGHTYSVVNLRYYLSEIVLHEKNGSTVSSDQIHLRNIHDLSTRQIVIDNVPDGEYTSVSFVFGLNDILNVNGGLENTVENINMEWPLPNQEGYHYMKFDGRYDSMNMGVINSFNIHTGATNGNQNWFEVALSFPQMSVRSNAWTIGINMDINEWLQNPNSYDFVGNEIIMMDQTAQEILQENGATVFSISSITQNE